MRRRRKKKRRVEHSNVGKIGPRKPDKLPGEPRKTGANLSLKNSLNDPGFL